MSQLGNISGAAPRANQTIEAMKEVLADETLELAGEQASSQDAYQESLSEMVNPFARGLKDQKKLTDNKSRIDKTQKAEKGEPRLMPVEKVQEFANQAEKRNPELKASALVRLRELIKPGDTKEEILKKVLEMFPDVSLADEAMEFLMETTVDEEMKKTLKEAKDEFNNTHGREISAGKNMGTVAREAESAGLGTATSLRDMYRNITGNPRDSATLFDELSQKYAFKDLKKVVSFLLHSLGTDMKSSGPSIPRGQLHTLLTETRSLQAILGVYRFFNGRMALVDKMFARDGLSRPPQLNFESLSKAFMQLVSERYPTSDKIMQQGGRLGIDKWIQAKIIAFSQLRDAIREVAGQKIYRSVQHRDELYLAILEALESLEDELDALLGREEDEEEEGGQQEEEEEGEQE